MHPIFTSIKVALLSCIIVFIGCTEKSEKSDTLTKNGDMLIYFYEHFKDYERKNGKRPESIDEIFDTYPDFKKDMMAFSGNLSSWIYYPDETSKIIIKIESSDKNDNLFLNDKGQILLRAN